MPTDPQLWTKRKTSRRSIADVLERDFPEVLADSIDLQIAMIQIRHNEKIIDDLMLERQTKAKQAALGPIIPFTPRSDRCILASGSATRSPECSVAKSQ